MAGRPCTVCGHKDRREIEAAAARGEKARSISVDYAVSERALARHLSAHAVRSMEKALVAAGIRDLAAGIGLNEEVTELQARTLAILTKAEKSARTFGVAIGAIREARLNLELLGKFTGKLRPESQVNVLVTSPEWLQIRATLVEALRPWPPALEAAGRALATIGGRDDAR